MDVGGWVGMCVHTCVCEYLCACNAFVCMCLTSLYVSLCLVVLLSFLQFISSSASSAGCRCRTRVKA